MAPAIQAAFNAGYRSFHDPSVVSEPPGSRQWRYGFLRYRLLGAAGIVLIDPRHNIAPSTQSCHRLGFKYRLSSGFCQVHCLPVRPKEAPPPVSAPPAPPPVASAPPVRDKHHISLISATGGFSSAARLPGSQLFAATLRPEAGRARGSSARRALEPNGT